MVMYKTKMTGAIASRSFGKVFGGPDTTEEDAKIFLNDMMLELNGYRLLETKLLNNYFKDILDQKIYLLIQSNEFDFQSSGIYDVLDDFYKKFKINQQLSEEIENSFFLDLKKHPKKYINVSFNNTKLTACVRNNFKRLMLNDERHIKMARLTLLTIEPFQFGSVRNGTNQESIKLLFERIFKHVEEELKEIILDEIFDIPNSLDIDIEEDNIDDKLKELYIELKEEI